MCRHTPTRIHTLLHTGRRVNSYKHNDNKGVGEDTNTKKIREKRTTERKESQVHLLTQRERRLTATTRLRAEMLTTPWVSRK